jgi:glycosyltransferase involved in cell wall biosynthesis
VCALCLGLPLALLAVDLVGGRSSAGVLPAVAWLPAAAAFGLTALLRGRRAPAASAPQRDAVDDEAAEDFDLRYGRPVLAPVTVVIAAYHEEDGLPGVLATLPESVCDLDVDVLVVDDGSTDGTAAVVESDPRARVVRCRTNRGQGAALRLGYRIAREHGAQFIVTTDADGQYDVADLATVLRPILDGRADFVTGSRLLGHQHTHDRVRRAGVHVFAWIVSAMVGRRITDTSFGLRAMRAEVTGAVTLNQPQYQSSELLIGVLSHGFRVLEVPATMHVRSAGASKKGRNLVYGSRYARVVLGTWWREGCPRPVSTSAPAVRGQGRR